LQKRGKVYFSGEDPHKGVHMASGEGGSSPLPPLHLTEVRLLRGFLSSIFPKKMTNKIFHSRSHGVPFAIDPGRSTLIGGRISFDFAGDHLGIAMSQPGHWYGCIGLIGVLSIGEDPKQCAYLRLRQHITIANRPQYLMLLQSNHPVFIFNFNFTVPPNRSCHNYRTNVAGGRQV